MTDDKRLIEVAFPLKQASLDSVHEKNVRHGHVSTLHVWPARRPLAASRAALIAALLPDPGDPEQRRRLLERMGGRVVEKIERKKLGGRTVEKVKEETVGGILHWGRENDPDLDWFRREIRKAYGGRAPRVLDPFAGGGAIPLEAMRLGCDVTAVDINPVAWFILKCTLEYPQKLAGETRLLPEFAFGDRDFMQAFLKAKGFKGAGLRTMLERLGHGSGDGEVQLDTLPHDDPTLEADLAWHVRAWGRWVLARARKDLAPCYPTYAEFEPLKPGKDFEPEPMRLLDTDGNGVPQIDPLNAGFDDAYLKDPRNPRWLAKPTVAYLWARTVGCKQCRATAPLLKTRWLCKKDGKRVRLITEPNPGKTGVVFDVEADVPQSGGSTARRREHDRRLGAGTMSRTGAACPCCGTIMTMEDIRLEGRAGRLGAVMTAVVVEGPKGKEYRLPTPAEIEAATVSDDQLQVLFAEVPFGLPEEPLAGQDALGFRVPLYGFDTWRKLFTNRQLLALGHLLLAVRSARKAVPDDPSEPSWTEAIAAYLAIVLDKTADYGSSLCTWHNSGEKIGHTFARFALPMVWDTTELAVANEVGGAWPAQLDWVARYVEHAQAAVDGGKGDVLSQSAIAVELQDLDVVITDPPYYDAIPYSDLMDFFHIWLRRCTYGLGPESDAVFHEPIGPKWDHSTNDGELIDDASRFDGDKQQSKASYEDGMCRAFRACHRSLNARGRMIVVFANKQPAAWEALASALIRAGFIVDGSWPIQTEMGTRMRAMASAALSSSVWIVCRKRTELRPGWDNAVLAEMRSNITLQLRDFWDAGIRGPDFVWAATGPALEAFSKYPAVKKADDPGAVMTVSEFLREVRRIVVDFVVGRVLTRTGGGADDVSAAEGLDDVTTYYLLHRHDFGMEEAPIGACILYALSCNLSDSALAGQHDLLARSGKALGDEEDEGGESAEDADGDAGGGSGAKVRLKAWHRRRGHNLGLETTGGRPVPMIDQVHKLMHLWRGGDQAKVDDYLDSRGLKRNALFNQLLQALIELGAAGSDERSVLESLSNHVATRERIGAPRQGKLI